VDSSPHYDLFDESYARLSVITETMNEQQKHFVSKIRECDLLHETDASLPHLRHEASLKDDYESSLPLCSNFVNDTPVTDGEEVFSLP